MHEGSPIPNVFRAFLAHFRGLKKRDVRTDEPSCRDGRKLRNAPIINFNTPGKLRSGPSKNTNEICPERNNGNELPVQFDFYPPFLLYWPLNHLNAQS